MPANKLRKSLTVTIAVPAILMATATILLLWQLSRQQTDTEWVEHTDRVMLLAETAKTEFLRAQNAMRGFLISSDPNDRAPLQEHWNKSQEIIKELAALVADNPSQEQRLITLNGLESQWLEAAGGADSTSVDTEKRELARRAAAIGSKVLAQFEAVSAAESVLRITRDAQRDLQYQIEVWGIPLAAIALAFGLTFVAWREIRSASGTFANALRTAEQANQGRRTFSRSSPTNCAIRSTRSSSGATRCYRATNSKAKQSRA